MVKASKYDVVKLSRRVVSAALSGCAYGNTERCNMNPLMGCYVYVEMPLIKLDLKSI